MDYRSCSECYEKRCLCEKLKTDYDTKLKDSFGDEKISLNYELNYYDGNILEK